MAEPAQQEIPLGRGGARPNGGRKKGIGNDAYAALAKAKAKNETFKAHNEELKFKQAAGKLIEASAHERALADAFKVIAVTLESLPDVLERDAGIDGVAVERAQVVIDRMRDDLHSRLVSGIVGYEQT